MIICKIIRKKKILIKSSSNNLSTLFLFSSVHLVESLSEGILCLEHTWFHFYGIECAKIWDHLKGRCHALCSWPWGWVNGSGWRTARWLSCPVSSWWGFLLSWQQWSQQHLCGTESFSGFLLLQQTWWKVLCIDRC